MRIGLIGINHKSADLSLREKLAACFTRIFTPEHAPHIYVGSVLLSTCNRVELYFHAHDIAGTYTHLLRLLRQTYPEEGSHKLYSYFGRECFLHLARVTAGMDSALVGETEIQGQVKRAYVTACHTYALPSALHFLFQKCLQIGKHIRSTLYPKYLPSLEEMLVHTGIRLLGDLGDKRLLFVGLSEINRKIFAHCKQLGYRHLFFCNRSEEKGALFAAQEEIGLLPWQELETSWGHFDATIVGTKSPHFLIDPRSLTPASRCQLVVDLSVPRNVDPAVGQYLHLINVDQLYQAIDTNKQKSALEMTQQELHLLNAAVDRQIEIFQQKTSQPLPIHLSTAI